jgi:hypothetical protein
MKAYVFLSSPLAVVSGELHVTADLPPGKEAPQCSRIGMDDVQGREILPQPGLEIRPLGHATTYE